MTKETVLNTNIYPRLKQLRVQKGLSEKDIALVLKVSVKKYIRCESQGKIATSTLNDLADFYNVSVDYLLGRVDDPTPYPID